MDTGASSSPPSPPGLVSSIRSLCDGLIGSVQDRVELFSVELQEEKHRLIQLLLWAAATMVLGLLALVFVSILLLVVFWDSARVLVASLLALLYGAGFVGVGLAFRRFLQRQERPFASTLAELREDRACMRSES